MQPTTLTCMIADDDEIDRLTTVAVSRQYPWLQVAGIFDNAEDLLAATDKGMPDVLFLDIDMPGMSGLQLRSRLTQVPACIFITAYPDYAVDGFELEALDFIVKPLKADRFAKTMRRLQDYFTFRNKAALLDDSLGGDSIFIKDGHHKIKLQLHQVLYLEALKDYTSIVTTGGKHCVLSALGNLLKVPAFKNFVRIHRSYAVQKHFIEQVRTTEVLVQNILLPIGRQFRDALNLLT